MRLQSIEQFIAVIDAGSIRGAARRLGISQPALTRALQQLEADLGVRLMQRSVRGISLTHAGQAFLARARVAWEELRKATEEARQSAQEGRALLSMGLSPVAASVLLPELAAVLLQRTPKVRLRLLELTPSALLGLVRDEELDWPSRSARVRIWMPGSNSSRSSRSRCGLRQGLVIPLLVRVRCLSWQTRTGCT